MFHTHLLFGHCVAHDHRTTTDKDSGNIRVSSDCVRGGDEVWNAIPATRGLHIESAMIAAVQEVLSNARIRGCLLHFLQALWRKVQDLGFTVLCKEDQTFNRLVRRAAALPFVPPNQVHYVWMTALNEVADEVDRFKDYVTTTWVDDIEDRFPIELWSQYDNIAGIRTNNHLEGWHSKLNRAINRPHPNTFALSELLKEEQRR